MMWDMIVDHCDMCICQSKSHESNSGDFMCPIYPPCVEFVDSFNSFGGFFLLDECLLYMCIYHVILGIYT